jgi:hypothetical protein
MPWTLAGVCASSARGHDWFGGELGRLTYIDRIAGQRGGSGGGGAARSVGWGGEDWPEVAGGGRGLGLGFGGRGGEGRGGEGSREAASRPGAVREEAAALHCTSQRNTSKTEREREIDGRRYGGAKRKKQFIFQFSTRHIPPFFL